MNETKAYLLSGADDDGYEDMDKERAKQQWAQGEIIRIQRERIAALEAENAEYNRLQAALARLQAIDKPVSVWVGWSAFWVTLHNEYDHDIEICSAEAKTLLVACEAALAAYDVLSGGE